MIASQEGHLDVVEFLLKAGVDLDLQTDIGATSFFVLVRTDTQQ